MELTKIPLEKFFYFIAGVVPGATALIVYHQAQPDAFQWVLALGFLGYKTKLAIVLCLAFVIGNTMTTFLSGLLGGIGGAMGSRPRPYIPPHALDVAPWRDPRWRLVLRKILGDQSPEDSFLITQPFYEQRRAGILTLPAPIQMVEMSKLDSEKLKSEINDGAWAQWYDHYHWIVLEPNEKDVFQQVRASLNFNFETAAIYLLLSTVPVPSLRHWWCIAPASAWCLMFIAEAYSSVRNYSNNWSTLSKQIRYLSEMGKTEKIETANAATA